MNEEWSNIKKIRYSEWKMEMKSQQCGRHEMGQGDC